MAAKLAVIRPNSDETSLIKGLLQASILSHASVSALCPGSGKFSFLLNQEQNPDS